MLPVMRTLGTVLLVAPLVACDLLGGGEAPPAQGPVRLPEATCAQVDATLRDLQGKIMIEFGAGDEAKVEEASWRSMGRASRDQVVNALAVRAACGTENPPAQQPVTVRNEAGDVLAERAVQVWEAPRDE
ncbi:MAG TPA: hypothetical protein VEZ48_14745 [Sphingomonadaceae bacterium]|nr:hypothetical protein [Sphingomonadaceae bacterium]